MAIEVLEVQVPATPATVQIQVAGPQGTDGNPSQYEMRGSGSPLGVITAPVGTYYTDIVGTNGAWRWIKKTGSGNTGWVVEDGDTGWRDITPSVANRAEGTVKIRRINSIAFLSLSAFVSNATKTDIPAQSGFQIGNGFVQIAPASNGAGNLLGNYWFGAQGLSYTIPLMGTIGGSYAYVVYDHARSRSVEIIKNWLLDRDIILAGRYSEWEYYNSDHAFLAGRKAAARIKEAEPKKKMYVN
mgnify:CR=1 FL=1